MRPLKWTLIIESTVYLILLIGNRQVAKFLYSGNGCLIHPLSPGNLKVPVSRTFAWKVQSAFANIIYNLWANKPIKDDELNEKGPAPQILLAKILVNSDISEVNSTMLKFKVWGISGSTRALNKKGDYNKWPLIEESFQKSN